MPQKQAILRKLKAWKENAYLFVMEGFDWSRIHGYDGPSEQQKEVLLDFSKNKRTSIRSGHGCHAAGTIVLMADGSCKLVEDIKVGDQLMGNDSTPRTVLKLYRGKEFMYRIKYHDDTYYDVNASHKLALRACRNKGRFKKGQITTVPVKEYLLWSQTDKITNLGFKESIELPDRPVAIPPYILGLWLGDGWQDRPAFTSVDPEIIYLLDVYAKSCGMKCKSAKDRKSHYISSGRGGKNYLLEGLQFYGLINNKQIPQEYLMNSKEKRLQLLAGLLDSDGYLDPRNKRVFEITQKREDLARDIVFLAQSVGCHATMNVVNKTWKTHGEKQQDSYFRISISRNTDIIPTQVKRKQAKEIPDSWARKLNFGFTVIPLKEDDYYGFEVDGNHLYMLADFTVTRNTGKDALASWLIYWFMVTRAYAKVACTAPTAHQLGDILWSELSKWHRMSFFQDEFIIQKDKMFHKDAPKEYWARAISPSVKASKEEQAETLAGLHADHLFIVVDEASGVPDPVFIPLEGAMTQEDNKVLLIGNPTKNKGYFHDTQFDPELGKKWHRYHWDSRKSSNVSPEMIDYFRMKYGEDSNVFRIRVAGEPPLEDENTLIPLSWAIECVGNEIFVPEDEPIYLGVDVARYGDDSSVILPRKGDKIMPWKTYRNMNTMDLASFVVQDFIDLRAEGIGIDGIGVGAGVADNLYKRPNAAKFTHEVNVSSAPTVPGKYRKLRDELWWRMRVKCERKMYSFPDVTVHIGGVDINLGHELANELSGPTYDPDSGGGLLKVEGKREMKKRGIPSPNIADALGISEFFYSVAFDLWGLGEENRKKRKKRKHPLPGADDKRHYGRDNWMYV